ncbi:N-formylglutamate deformylase [Taklimakanibacter deserti]|uniref:N-formylglutamate deformylase n=1 Tax=Taklimakanibacter deserti TaxID=2267839 RepID=UPI000E65ADB0
MTTLYDIQAGEGPLIFSVPHAGTELPSDIAERLTPHARTLPDTDWHVEQLYDFSATLGATLIRANVSRYVIDLNRPPQDESLYPGQATTGLCPPIEFDGTPIYKDGKEVPAPEVARRRETYWQPYHDRLAAEIDRVKTRHGYALLFDCHSIASRVPRLFPGTLPDLNLGTVHGASCAGSLQEQITGIMVKSGLSHVVNGRFVGGHITRQYGKPSENVHAVQMEKGQDCHLMDDGSSRLDPAKVAKLKPVLRRIAEAMLAWRP